nr:hypothetical protein Iba_chr09dCG2680 [Ipomoea batatas]
MCPARSPENVALSLCAWFQLLVARESSPLAFLRKYFSLLVLRTSLLRLAAQPRCSATLSRQLSTVL